MNFTDLKKDPSIIKVLEDLSVVFADQLKIQDYWESDLAAVGIVSKSGKPSQLVYISTFELPEGRYSAELEEASPLGSDFPYQTTDRFESIDFQKLIEIVSQHLKLRANA